MEALKPLLNEHETDGLALALGYRSIARASIRSCADENLRQLETAISAISLSDAVVEQAIKIRDDVFAESR